MNAPSISQLRTNPNPVLLILLTGIFAGMANGVWAGSATNITGLYYTGLNSSGGLQ